MPDRTIAIVDDDPTVRASMSSLLRSFGYGTATYASAEEFLNSSIVEQAACVISDVKMPGMSGAELQRSLIAGGRRLPFILMSGFPEENVKSRALAAGAIGFFTKPCETRSLISCIE